MSDFIDRPKYLCALGGAIATLTNLPRVVPILHAAAGCGGNLGIALNGAAGYLGSGYCGGLALPSSNVVEHEVVFGGEKRLKEQIENTLKIMDGDLYVVVTGCMVDMIGDDIHSVVKNLSSPDKPILALNTGGFKGTSFKGYELVLQTLFREYVKKSVRKKRNTVNLWGIVPAQDVFWEGNLVALKALLNKLGVRVNTFFAPGETLSNLRNAASASLNLVVSEAYGVEAAKVFEEVHGVPFVTLPFPIGDHGTERFLRLAGKALQASADTVEEVIRGERAHYYNYVERIADIYNDIELQRYAVIVADANYAPALARFAADDLGWLPELVVIPDLLDEERQAQVLKGFDGFKSGLKPKVAFDTNVCNVEKHLREHWPAKLGQRYVDSFSPAFVLGSVFERELAEKLGAPHLSVSFPISNRVVLDRTYAGYAGGLRLIEDIFSSLVAVR
jgi:nitrogenase molybdenum-iron protein beta chain